jgi:hypothetical protein
LTTNSLFDRSYEYDHLGRVTKGLSGAEARGGAATEDRPYNETFGYDAMNHLTARQTYNWDRFDALADTYSNNRRVGWVCSSLQAHSLILKKASGSLLLLIESDTKMPAILRTSCG